MEVCSKSKARPVSFLKVKARPGPFDTSLI